MLADAISRYEHTGPSKIAERLWPQDRDTPILIKAAANPADTTTSGWASQLSQTAVSDLVLRLGPATCAGELMRLGMALRFENNAQVNVPAIVASASDSAWVAQGSPFPIKQMTIGAGATLTPRRLVCAFAMTRDLVEHSAAEAIITAKARESIAIALDTAMLDATAGSTSRPAGLRNGVSTLTATAGGGTAALIKDIGQLVQAVAGVGGNNVAIVGAADTVAKILTAVGGQFPYRVFASGGLASGFVMAIALDALASAISDIRFESSTETVIHMEDTSPLAIGTAGAPATVAAPAKSMWQTDCVAFRLILETSWGVRSSGAVAWTSAVTW
jgi:hypothetical protein